MKGIYRRITLRKRFGILWVSTVSILLVLSGVFLIAATNTVAAAQEGDYTYIVSGSPLVATITGYTGIGGYITIPSTLGGYPTAAIGENAFFYCTALDYVTIPSSVTTIGVAAFEYCTSLASVTIPNGVTTIGELAFNSCGALISVTIPSSVTYIGNRTFNGCTSLVATNVDPGNPNYASIDGVLYDKAIATLIRHPSGKAGAFTVPNSITSIGNDAFDSCSYLTSVNISNSVTSIGDWAFSDCTSLTSVNISNSVTFIGDWAFYYCTSLTSITFSGLVAPVIVGANWIYGTDAGIRGHAYVASNFPAPGGNFNGLTMGAVIPGRLASVSPAIVSTILILVAVIAIAMVLVAAMFVMRKRKGKK